MTQRGGRPGALEQRDGEAECVPARHGAAGKARKKPYFGRIDFQDPRLSFLESYYIGRVGISDEKAEPVVLDWRAPISSVYYENSTGPCSYTVSSEGTFSIDLKRKRTYEIENDHLKDFLIPMW